MTSTTMNPDPVTLPHRIKKGDCIGLVSPSGPIQDQERFDAGVRILHELGYRTRQKEIPSTEHEYLAADDKYRAQEFHAMWADPEVKAIMAVRGGYGCIRMLPYIDLSIVNHNPKRIIGFSDLTVLLNTLVDRAGIIAFHGPVITSLSSSDNESIDSFKNMLTGTVYSEKQVDGLKILRDGISSGTIRGGNLTTIAHLLGTPWEIPCKGTILLLEDTGEPMYKLDRILTQLYVSGRLEHLSGLILGIFDCGSDECANEHLQENVWNRVLELTTHFDYPIWGNFPVGHREKNHTIPLGASATMDSTSNTLTIHSGK